MESDVESVRRSGVRFVDDVVPDGGGHPDAAAVLGTGAGGNQVDGSAVPVGEVVAEGIEVERIGYLQTGQHLGAGPTQSSV